MISKKELIELYCNRKMNIKQIARGLKCAASTISYYMKKYHIKGRQHNIGDLNRGKSLSKETRDKMRKEILDRYANGWQNPKKGKSPSLETRKKMSLSGRGRNKRAHLSEWDGSHTPRHHKFLVSAQWKETRNAVFKRDNYVCQLTGKRGGDLECHHIIPKSELPEELWVDMSNLITLSKEAHKKTKGKEQKYKKILQRILKNTYTS